MEYSIADALGLLPTVKTTAWYWSFDINADEVLLRHIFHIGN